MVKADPWLTMYGYSAKSTTTNEYETATYHSQSHQISSTNKNTLWLNPKKKHTKINHPPTLIPPLMFSTRKTWKKKSQKNVSLPINGWFIFPQIFAATNGQIFRALKQAVKPSIQSWQNPTSVALNDFGAVRRNGGKNGDWGWMFWDGFVRINGDGINGL